MMKKYKKYDVVVVGNGITGLSTALHLEQAGITNIALSATTRQPFLEKKTAGIVTGGQIDNFTRFSHNYGNDFAGSLWDFGNKASEHVASYCKKNVIDIETGPRIRLITSSSELKEAETAVGQMQGAGFSAKLSETATFNNFFSNRVLAIQDDGHLGSLIDTTSLGKTLNSQIKAEKLPGLSSFEKNDSLYKIFCGEQGFETEMLVFACHLAIGEFLPEIRDALVSVADQWGIIGADTKNAAMESFIYTANHTYEWGSLSKFGQVTLGGGRYLRHHAGIDAKEALYEKKIEDHLRQQFSLAVPEIKLGNLINSVAGLDCRPCDELPIIGPMFGDSRILVATGYMGNGIALGFYAGKCLTEFILKGHTEICPRRLHPERLRSLER